MVLAYDFYKSFWLINPQLTEEKFLEIVGAKSGYSLDMFSRIYQSIFSELIDVEKEYEKYYSYEYETFVAYLYKKYNLEVDAIDRLLKLRDEYPDSRVFRKEDHSYGDYQIPNFLEADQMRDKIFEILNMKHENKI